MSLSEARFSIRPSSPLTALLPRMKSTEPAPSRRLSNRGLRLAGAAALLATAACAPVGPDFVRPDVPVQPEWLEAELEEFETSEPELTEWWRQLDDPVLDRLIELAYERNNSLKIAGLRVIEAQAALNIAVGNQYPQVQVLAGDATAVGNSKNGIDGQTTETSFRQANLGDNLSWELDFWGRFRRGVEAADASLLEFEDTAQIQIAPKVSF